jgi:putative transcriptional regulator
VTVASLKGRLLIASTALRDPNFDRTLVLMLHHDEDGAVGLVINRPSQMDVAEALPQWSDLAAPPALLFIGGPVGAGAAICLARLRSVQPVAGWQPLLGRLGTFDLGSDPVEAAAAVDGLRVFSGYSGWGAGQLEGELELDAWVVVDAIPDDALFDQPDQLWRTVLRRQRGGLALLAGFPHDPSMN